MPSVRPKRVWHCRISSAASHKPGNLAPAPVRKTPPMRAFSMPTRANSPRTKRNNSLARAPIMRLTIRSEEHTSELQSLRHLVCRLLLEKKKQTQVRPERAVSRTSLLDVVSALRTSVCRRCSPGMSQSRALQKAPPLPAHFLFFNDTATTEIYTLSLHDALPICLRIAPDPDPCRLGGPTRQRPA